MFFVVSFVPGGPFLATKLVSIVSSTNIVVQGTEDRPLRLANGDANRATELILSGQVPAGGAPSGGGAATAVAPPPAADDAFGAAFGAFGSGFGDAPAPAKRRRSAFVLPRSWQRRYGLTIARASATKSEVCRPGLVVAGCVLPYVGRIAWRWRVRRMWAATCEPGGSARKHLAHELLDEGERAARVVLEALGAARRRQLKERD